uniref:Uncharacterized protein n=1 Tax=Glossina pallidipes TaxID=7398 RepID=A0A1B0AF85_GLOPL
MRIRKNVWPRRYVDWLCFLLIGVFMPIVFIFEMIVVLPLIHPPGSFLHTFTFAMAAFLIFNITGNFVACVMVDTSVGVILNGGVCYERTKGTYPYGNGSWQANLQEIFGKRMHLVWLSPFLQSELIDSNDIWKID